MDNKDLFIKEKLQKDQLISKKAEDVFDNFLKGDFKMEEEKNEKKVEEKTKATKIPMMKRLLSTAASLVIVFGMANVYATTNGYGNVFFMIKYLVTGEKNVVTDKTEILSDRDISISYEPVRLTENIRMQIRNLQIKDNEAKLIIAINEAKEEDSSIVPLKYKVYNSANELLCEQKSQKDKKDIEYTEELILDKFKEEDNILILEVYKANNNKIAKITIDLQSRNITVEGEAEALKKVSEIELKKYLGVISEYNGEPESDEGKIKYAQAIFNEIKGKSENKVDEINNMLESLGIEKVSDSFTQGEDYKKITKDGTSYYEVINGWDEWPYTVIDIKDMSYCDGLYTALFTYIKMHEEGSFDEDYSNVEKYEATVYFRVNDDDKYSKFKVVKYEEDSTNTEVDEDKIKETFQKYLDLIAAQEGAPREMLEDLSFINDFDNETSARKNGFIKTNVKYSDFKEKMLTYVTERCYENDFSEFYIEEDGYLCYANVGATGVEYEVTSVKADKEVKNKFSATTVWQQEEVKENIDFDFMIDYNGSGKIVIDYAKQNEGKENGEKDIYTYSSIKGLYQGTAKDATAPNKDRQYELDLYEDGTFSYESYEDIISGITGNYIIVDDEIILNYLFTLGNDVAMGATEGQKILKINEDGTITDTNPDMSNSTNLVLKKTNDNKEYKEGINYIDAYKNNFLYNKTNSDSDMSEVPVNKVEIPDSAYTKVKGIYKGTAKDEYESNKNREYELYLHENGTFAYVNGVFYEQGVTGNYTIVDDTIYLNYLFATGSDAGLDLTEGKKELIINKDGSITDSKPEETIETTLVLKKSSVNIKDENYNLNYMINNYSFFYNDSNE